MERQKHGKTKKGKTKKGKIKRQKYIKTEIQKIKNRSKVSNSIFQKKSISMM